MCIIIDNNIVGPYLDYDEGAGSILAWIMSNRGKLVVCDELLDEYAHKKGKETRMVSHVSMMRSLNKVRDVFGDDMEIGRIKVDKIMAKKNMQMRSQDHHILRMAAFTNCKLLLTEDKKLTFDFERLLGGLVVPFGPAGQNVLAENPCN